KQQRPEGVFSSQPFSGQFVDQQERFESALQSKRGESSAPRSMPVIWRRSRDYCLTRAAERPVDLPAFLFEERAYRLSRSPPCSRPAMSGRLPRVSNTATQPVAT